MRLASILESGWLSLMDGFAPLRCPLCGRRLAAIAAGPAACRACLHCGLPPAAAMRQLRADGAGEFLLFAGGAYEGAWQRMVRAYKYGRDPGARALLARAAAGALPGGAGWEALVPVPGHPRRVRERGWEPAAELAEAVGDHRALPVRRLLFRVRDTPPLTGRGARERRRLVRDAFRARPAAGTLLVLDDVATTGATFRACRRALLDAGAQGVDLLVAAATPRRFF